MSKNTLKAVPAVTINKVWSPKEGTKFQGDEDTWNYRQDYGDLSDVISQLADSGGWNPQYPIVCEEMTDEEAAKAKADIEADYLEIKNRFNKNVDDIQAKAELDVMEKWFVNKKGEAIVPKYITVTGNRRMNARYAWLGALLIAADNKYENVNIEVPVLVPTDGRLSREQRLYQQAFENGTKTAGAKAPTDAEELRVVSKLVTEEGYNQGKIRGMYKAVRGLRLYFAVICSLYQVNYLKHKGMTLLQRFMAPQFRNPEDKKAKVQNPDWLPFSNFGQQAFQGVTDTDKKASEFGPFGARCEIEANFEKRNKTLTREPGGVPLTRPKKDDFNQWVSYWSKGGASSGPALSRTTVNTLSETHTSLAVRDAMLAVTKNSIPHLDRLKERAPVMNVVQTADKRIYAIYEEFVPKLSELDVETQLTLLGGFADKVREAYEAAAPSLEEETADEEVLEEIED